MGLYVLTYPLPLQLGACTLRVSVFVCLCEIWSWDFAVRPERDFDWSKTDRERVSCLSCHALDVFWNHCSVNSQACLTLLVPQCMACFGTLGRRCTTGKAGKTAKLQPRQSTPSSASHSKIRQGPGLSAGDGFCCCLDMLRVGFGSTSCNLSSRPRHNNCLPILLLAHLAPAAEFVRVGLPLHWLLLGMTI